MSDVRSLPEENERSLRRARYRNAARAAAEGSDVGQMQRELGTTAASILLAATEAKLAVDAIDLREWRNHPNRAQVVRTVREARLAAGAARAAIRAALTEAEQEEA